MRESVIDAIQDLLVASKSTDDGDYVWFVDGTAETLASAIMDLPEMVAALQAQVLLNELLSGVPSLRAREAVAEVVEAACAYVAEHREPSGGLLAAKWRAMFAAVDEYNKVTK